LKAWLFSVLYLLLLAPREDPHKASCQQGKTRRGRRRAMREDQKGTERLQHLWTSLREYHPLPHLFRSPPLPPLLFPKRRRIRNVRYDRKLSTNLRKTLTNVSRLGIRKSAKRVVSYNGPNDRNPPPRRPPPRSVASNLPRRILLLTGYSVLLCYSLCLSLDSLCLFLRVWASRQDGRRTLL